ncbi:MAG: glycoside hydrolase family 25 protein [Bacillota bacterium]
MQQVSPNCIKGIDVSHWQGDIDWHGIKSDGIRFAYLKATEGKTTIDSKFVSNAAGARSVGIPTGAYHFARPDLNITLENAKEEAQSFINAMQKGFGAGNFGDISPSLDLEVPARKDQGTISTDHLLAWADAYKNYFKKQTGKTLMLYTGEYFIKMHGNFHFPAPGNPLADMPLWIALYPKSSNNQTSPANVGSWSKWTIWQYTNLGKVKGITGNVDLNWALPELLIHK